MKMIGRFHVLTMEDFLNFVEPENPTAYKAAFTIKPSGIGTYEDYAECPEEFITALMERRGNVIDKFMWLRDVTTYPYKNISFLDKNAASVQLKPVKIKVYKGARTERGRMTPKLRYKIMERDNFRCKCCGRGAADGSILHVDHIHPVSKGGITKMDNLQTLCRECNLGKGVG